VTAPIAAGPTGATGTPWRVWARQTWAVARLELPRCVKGGRAAALYLLAAAPIGLMAMAAVAVALQSFEPSPAESERGFAAVYAVFVLRWCVFFACVAVFLNLFRSEVVDGTLHYWLLAPVRREALVLGKYGAGLAVTATVMTAATVVAALMTYIPFDTAVTLDRLVVGPALAHVASFALATALACVGYGALFLLLGMWFRNPVLPTLTVLGWEYVNFLLPPALRSASIVFHLQSLLPLPLTEGPLGVVAEPSPPAVAVTGILVFSAVCQALAAWRLRRMEVAYGEG